MKIKNKLKIFNEIDCIYKIKHISKELNNGLKNEEYFILQNKDGLKFIDFTYFSSINDVYNFIIDYTSCYNYYHPLRKNNGSNFHPYLWIPGKKIILNEIFISYKDIEELKSLKYII